MARIKENITDLKDQLSNTEGLDRTSLLSKIDCLKTTAEYQIREHQLVLIIFVKIQL